MKLYEWLIDTPKQLGLKLAFLVLGIITLVTVSCLAFFSDQVGETVSATAGTVDIEITDQKIEAPDRGEMSAAQLINPVPPQTVAQNTVENWTTANVNTFSYTVESVGTNAVEVTNTWYIAWDTPASADPSNNLQERYYIYIYPTTMSDTAVIRDIMTNWANNAVFIHNDPTPTAITETYYLPGEAQTAANQRQGIRMELPGSIQLDGSQQTAPSSGGKTTTTYSYKVVFGSSRGSYNNEKEKPQWFIDLFTGENLRFDVVSQARGITTTSWTDIDYAHYLFTNAQVDPDVRLFSPSGEVSYSEDKITPNSVVATIITNRPVTANQGFTCTTDTSQTPNVYSCTKTYTDNATEMVTITDDWGMSNQIEVKVSNIYKRPFVTTWQIAAAGDAIVLPFLPGIEYKLYLDWGDGNKESITTTTANVSHNYVAPGQYQIKIYGQMPLFSLNDFGTSKDKLISIDSWGYTDTVTYSFTDAVNLVNDPAGLTMPDPDTFRLAKTNWDGNLNFWYSGLAYLFSGCTSLTGPIPAGFLDSAVQFDNAAGMFASSGITGPIPANLFAASDQITTFQNTFSWSNGVSGQIPTGLFTGKNLVINYEETFAGTSLSGPIPTNLFADSPAVTTFKGTFAWVSGGLTDSVEHLFDNNLQVTDFTQTFAGCGQLTGKAPELWLRNPTPTGNGCFIYAGAPFTNAASIPSAWKN